MFVKICGIANETDALLAAGLGADAVGLIFAPSTRQITKDVARDIVRRLPPEILSVGVFRNEHRSRVVQIANTVGLRAVQLHGHETAEDTRWIAERVPAVIRAFAVSDPALDHLDDFGKIDVLIDSATPGGGEVFDWTLLSQRRFARPFILAGGLGPDNVADAIATVRPWGVDVASGVEASPGRKDPVKLGRFITNARTAFEALPDRDVSGDDTQASQTSANQTSASQTRASQTRATNATADDELDTFANDWITADPAEAGAPNALFDWKEDPRWK